MNEFLKQSATRVQVLRMEDNAAPEKDSTTYEPHFNYFEIDTANKTLTELILELNAGIEDRYNCKKIIFGAAYGFSEFRFTPDYSNFRELSQYLLRLSCWLYRDKEFPEELKQALDKGASIYE